MYEVQIRPCGCDVWIFHGTFNSIFQARMRAYQITISRRDGHTRIVRNRKVLEELLLEHSCETNWSKEGF